VRGVPEAEALAVADLPVDGLLAAGLLVAWLLAAWLLAAERVVEDRPPAGEGVRVTGCVVDPEDDVSGVGVKVDGTEEPPAVQAGTAIASRTAPAARRPAASHASRVAAGVLSRIFMDPPRTRVRYTR
jgi:hypothetical protein